MSPEKNNMLNSHELPSLHVKCWVYSNIEFSIGVGICIMFHQQKHYLCPEVFLSPVRALFCTMILKSLQVAAVKRQVGNRVKILS